MLAMIFLTTINCAAQTFYKGDQDSFPGYNITPSRLRSYMNIFNGNQKYEYNKDHTRKNVIFDNDVFDSLFGFGDSKEIPVHVVTEDEIQKVREQSEFDAKKDKEASFLRRMLGISN